MISLIIYYVVLLLISAFCGVIYAMGFTYAFGKLKNEWENRHNLDFRENDNFPLPKTNIIFLTIAFF